MGRTKPRHLLHLEYEEAAQAYLRSLPLEHFMESTAQSKQRGATDAMCEIIHLDWPAFQCFGELLVQYPHGTTQVIRQVVPDNMIFVHPEPIKALSSFNVPLQPVKPFWVLEYVSKNNKRKDYDDNFEKYEKELKVPYYLTYFPDNEELTLHRLTRQGYRTVKPNKHGRYPIPQLEIEVGLIDGWVRFWFRGKLVPLPAELQTELEATRRLLDEERRQLEEERRQLDEERRRVEEERGRADREKDRADREKDRADREKDRADQERLARLALEEELARLRAQFGSHH